eukprot:XP_019924744.1 PREDICTED: uncharacterized protein LOC105332978 [Crassostrea gigas]
MLSVLTGATKKPPNSNEYTTERLESPVYYLAYNKLLLRDGLSHSSVRTCRNEMSRFLGNGETGRKLASSLQLDTAEGSCCNTNAPDKISNNAATTTEALTTTQAATTTEAATTTQVPSTTTEAAVSAAINEPIPFGSSESDLVLTGDDRTGERLSAPTGVFVGDGSSGIFSDVTIGTNGVIGIGERYNSFTIRDLSSSLTRTRRILCPFWADLVGNTDMTEQGGKVYYRSYTKANKNDQTILNKVNDIVKKYYTDYPKFDATWLVKATWYNMSFFGYSASENKVSFQSLLVTDGENTFAIFNYMNVNSPPINNLKISMGSRFRNFYTSNSYTNQRAAFRMSSIPGNTG